MNPPLGISNEVQKYLQGLQVGERVQECGNSGQKGWLGTIYISKHTGSKCVLWDKQPGHDGQLGTSVTWGTRRLCDV